MSAVQNPAALPPRFSPRSVAYAAVSSVAGVALTLLHQLTIAIHVGPSRSAFNQTVNVNGYQLVPSSTEEVTSFYGPWTYGPGGLNIFQGKQQYDLVDPNTQRPLGTVTALVSSGKPLGLSRFSQLLVTAAEGDVGTGAGQTPPAGSVIANLRIIGKFGWNYSAMPSDSGDVVRTQLTTPFGEIPLRFFNRFDAAQGIADHTVDNRPIDLGNGYSIAPSDAAAEIYTGTSGIAPIYQTVQSRQRFDIRDSSGASVGSFDAEVTTTWDIIFFYTQAVLVTNSYGDNVGTGVGQVPPPGSVYNVVYLGADTNYDLYSSMPSPSGDVISMIQNRDGTVRNIKTFPLNRLDASAPPVVKRLVIAGGNSILPISEVTPVGVNGLPPRDVQLQGYQRFGVYDKTGVRKGSFDAMIAQQWDLMGITSYAIVVTEVTDGHAGTAVGDVPPVGSVLNYLFFGNSGFGTSYWSLPSTPESAGRTKISYKILTPIIDIPTWSTYNASAGLDTVTFANPF